MSLLRQPLLVLDVETSGLPRHSWARPIEIAVVALDLAGRDVRCWGVCADGAPRHPLYLPRDAVLRGWA